MSYQPNLYSSPAPHGSAGHAPPPDPEIHPEEEQPRSAPLWLRRVELFLRVIVRLYLGLLLVVLPWTHLWDDNHIFNMVPQIAWLAASGITRGIVSGLGLLNIWIAIGDAVHYREP